MDQSYALEIDSYMYQSVASEGIHLISKSLRVPLYQFPIVGVASCRSLYYSGNDQSDEVEDLFHALSVIKREVPTVSYVSSGAILSDYQRIRVENVAARLSLHSLSFLWRRPTDELLRTIISASVDSIIVKVASFGLLPESHLGRRLSEVVEQLCELSKPPYCLNECGEGGEYETFTLDCPLFHHRLRVRSTPKVVMHSNDPFAPVAYLQLTDLALEDKPTSEVCQTSEDVLAIVDATISPPRRPFLTPLERLTDLRIKFASESSSDFSNLPQAVSSEFPNADQYSFSASLPSYGFFSPFAGDSLWFSETFIGTCESICNQETAVKNATMAAAKLLQGRLASVGLSFNHVVSCICLLNRPLTDATFSAFNTVYASVFGMPLETETPHGTSPQSPPHRCFPPSRVCLSVDSIPYSASQKSDHSSVVAVSLTVIVHPYNINGLTPLDGGCRGLHVQSISHWAPASTGPYSQAVTVTVPSNLSSHTEYDSDVSGAMTSEGKLFTYTLFSGQMGLIPETLTVPTSIQLNCSEAHALETECWLALRHCHRVLKAVSCAIWANLYAGICFGISKKALLQAKLAFHSAVCSVWFASPESDGLCATDEVRNHCCVCNTHVVWAQVSGLSNNSSIEWQFFTRSNMERLHHSPLVYGGADILTFLAQPCIIFSVNNSFAGPLGKCVIPVGGLLDRTDAIAALIL
ncbi:unnamed protein product [Dicrocoelium dendriticum]|nr:unnamed protein product [Dicrocoelium dendriticum]